MASKQRPAVAIPVPPPAVPPTSRDIILPPSYSAFLENLKARIRAAQIKASLAVNRELIELYWSIGRDIVWRQRDEGWGNSTVERLAADLQAEFPGVGSISARNIWHARSFYQAYTQPPKDLKQAVSDLPFHTAEVLPQPVSEIPWGHNIVLLQKLKDATARLWYAQQTTVNGWSRAMLTHWIESDLFARQGKAVTNFNATLPAAQSDLARELVKDPYNFDFLTLRRDAAEHELEQGLLDHIRKFLLELGAGFAFVGQQVPLEIEGEDFTLDLLFYHVRLRCYVVIDLKVVPFKPEFAGKMNFYLSAVDDLLRHPDDKPTIGLILCKSHKRTVAEYALRDLAKPVSVAKYLTKLVEALPRELAGALPTTRQIRAELDADLPASQNCRTAASEPKRRHRKAKR